MSKVLNEIYRIKNLMSIKEQKEVSNNVSGTVIIGDYFADMISEQFQTISHLVDENMTVNLLIKRLSSSEVYDNVSNLILSIGTVDFFKGLNSINALCNMISEVFPNADLYVFKGVISDFEVENEKEIEEINESGDIFYDEFEICGFEIIGDYPIISDVNVDLSNPAILDLMEFVNELGTSSDFDLEDTTIDLIPKNGISDDDTDFDTIYEFLEQFEKIYKSNKNYDITLGSQFKFDIMQIQIALNFIMGSNLEVNGKYDDKTKSVVSNFQNKMGLEKTGICDTDTLEEIFYTLKVKGFDEEDISKFLKGDTDIGETIMGILDISGAGLSSEQRENVNLLITYMKDFGITNPYTQIGVLSTIGKESGFIPQNEVGYGGASDERIEDVFGKRGTKCKGLKHDDEKFFDCVYGPTAKNDLGWDTGNDNPGDGYKYIGRGFNQITFKNNYKKYGNAVGIDLVSDPEKLNDVNIAAEAAVAFLTKGKSIPDFKSKEAATDYFVNINAGGLNGRKESRQNEHEWMDRFDVK